uniref:Ubiquitin-like protease family profile domain-containing protein n=1 Tax=Chenopodium quinoa TaxID=63459 RepID=A0A803M6I8_CHEQI
MGDQGTLGLKQLDMSYDDWHKAHSYILHNKDELMPYIQKHMRDLRKYNRRANEKSIADEHNRSFIRWFKDQVLRELQDSPSSISDRLKSLAYGPNFNATYYSGYVINGFTFYTRLQDGNSTMQNSGVTIEAEAIHFASGKAKHPVSGTMRYYGFIEEICELHYSNFSIPVFKCQRVDNNNGVDHSSLGMTFVNFNKIGHKEDPFILSSQAKQVFYMTDPSNKRMYMARKKKKVQPNDDSEESSCEEGGRIVLKKVGKAIHAGTQIPLQWHPSRRIPTGEHKTHFSTYISVMARERISIAYKYWHEVPTGVLVEVYGFISELSEKNREKAKKKSSSYRGGRLGYQYFEEEIFSVKDGVITFDNLADKEIHDAIIALEGQVQRGEIIVKGRDDILEKAMHKSEHGGSVRGVSSGITVKDYFGYNKPAPPSQLHAEIGMMKLVSMDNRQNFMMSFLMSCCSQEQIKSFMAVGRQQVGLGGVFGGDNTSSSLDAGFGGLTGGLRGFGGLTGGLGGFSGLTEGGSGGLAGGSGGLEGGQASGSLSLAGGSGGLESGSSGLAGGSRAPQLDDTFGQGLQGISLTQLLTSKIFEQGSKGHGFTHDSLGGADIYGTQGNRKEDNCTKTQSHTENLETEAYHVPWLETYRNNQLEPTTNLANQSCDLKEFPEGWSDCCLAIEGNNKELQIVANGQVEKTTDVRATHSRLMPPGHARVTITEDIVPTALLPCPNDELVYICHAKNSYTPWPITLIFPRKTITHSEKVLNVTTPSPHLASSQVSTTPKYVTTEKNREMVTSTWLRMLNTRAMVLKKRGVTLSIPIPKCMFLNEDVGVTLDYEDLLDWCFKREVGESQMNIFIKYLKGHCQNEGVSDMYGFCDTNVLSPMTPTTYEEVRSDYLARVFGCNEGKNVNKLFFAPYSDNMHWRLAVISPWNGLMCWLDPSGEENEINEFAKKIINDVLDNLNTPRFVDTMFVAICLRLYRKGYCGYVIRHTTSLNCQKTEKPEAKKKPPTTLPTPDHSTQ